MDTSKEMNVKAVEYHRNGVAGNGFWVVLFTKDNRNMMAIAFEGDKEKIAILDTDLLAQGKITFGENSWRYETFAPGILKAIEKEAA